jgi:hypothetical protein
MTFAVGWGMDGLLELAKFVQAGGTLITEGSTSTIFPEYGITSGVTVEEPRTLFVRGSILRGIISDAKSPIAYGFDGTQLPVYFSQAPVLAVSTGRRRIWRFWWRRGRWHQRRARSEHDTDGDAAQTFAYEQDSSATTGGGGGRAGASGDSARFQNLRCWPRRRGRHIAADPASRPRVDHDVPAEP